MAPPGTHTAPRPLLQTGSSKMANNSKWYVAGVLLIGAVIGIVFVGILTSVVHWAGSPKFCG